MAALAEAADRPSAEAAAAIVRKLAPATARPGAATEVPRPAGRRASAPGTGAVVEDRGAGTRTAAGSGAGTCSYTGAVPGTDACPGAARGRAIDRARTTGKCTV